MVVSVITLFLSFIISLIVSAVIIYFTAKFFGEKEDIKTAVIVAFVGSIIYALAYYLLGTGLLSAVIGGITWLLALQGYYKIGWAKSLLIAFIVWVVVSLLSFLPTVMGPL